MPLKITKQFFSLTVDFTKSVAKAKWLFDLRTTIDAIVDAVNELFARPYACMHAYHLGAGHTTTIALVDTYYTIVDPDININQISGFEFQNGNRLKVLKTGYYHAVWSMSLETAANNQEVEGTLGINDSPHLDIASHGFVINNNKPICISGTGILYLVVGDLVSFMVLNHTSAGNIVSDHVSLSLHQVG